MRKLVLSVGVILVVVAVFALAASDTQLRYAFFGFPQSSTTTSRTLTTTGSQGGGGFFPGGGGGISSVMFPIVSLQILQIIRLMNARSVFQLLKSKRPFMGESDVTRIPSFFPKSKFVRLFV